MSLVRRFILTVLTLVSIPWVFVNNNNKNNKNNKNKTNNNNNKEISILDCFHFILRQLDLGKE